MNTAPEISYEQRLEANRVAPVPPGARSHRTARWKDAEGHSLVAVVPKGMQVAENLKAFYWAERETYSGLLAAGATLSDFVVVNEKWEIIAISRTEPGDDADDIAWLSCMFMEMMQGRVAFVANDEVGCSNVEGAERCFVRLGAPND
jgi:hypothetical protein